MVTKVRVIIITCCGFQGDAIKLLHGRQEYPGVALRVALIQITCSRLGFLFLPVQTRADIAVANRHGVQPLGGVLLNVIRSGRRSITAFARIIVLVFTATIPAHQLGLVDPLVIAQSGIPVLAIQLARVRQAIDHKVSVIVLIAVIRRAVVITQSPHETAQVIGDLLLNRAKQRLTHKAVTIGLAWRIRRIDIKAAGIGIVAAEGDFGFIQYLLEGPIVRLIPFRADAGSNFSAWLVPAGDDVNHAANSIRTIQGGTRAANVFDTLNERNGDLAEIR